MSKTSFVAKQIRLQQWAEDIRSCNNRPPGTTVAEWCDERGIKKSAYYWRLRAVRNACLDVIDQTEVPYFDESSASADSTFVEINSMRGGDLNCDTIISLGHATIALNENISDAFLQRIMKAVYHAQ